MFSTFNMGLGMIAVVSAECGPAALRLLQQRKVTAWQVGRIEKSSGEPSATIEP
jgi:phosphoribosylaminoimidazole (AIR) synthetase